MDLNEPSQSLYFSIVNNDISDVVQPSLESIKFSLHCIQHITTLNANVICVYIMVSPGSKSITNMFSLSSVHI
jgi:hypothetical protein